MRPARTCYPKPFRRFESFGRRVGREARRRGSMRFGVPLLIAAALLAGQTALASPSLAAGIVATGCEPAAGTKLFVADFNNGRLPVADGNLARMPGEFSYAAPGELRVFVDKAADAGSHHHTMFSVSWGPRSGEKERVLAFDRTKTYRFCFDILVERQVPDPKWNILFQTKTWYDPGEISSNPTFALFTQDGQWRLAQRGDGDATVADKKFDRDVKADLGAIDYDVWSSWQIDIRFDWLPTGMVKVLHNGQEVWSADYVRTTYRDENPGGAVAYFGQYEYYSADSPDWNAVRFRKISVFELEE